jgi:hypothetical protein
MPVVVTDNNGNPVRFEFYMVQELLRKDFTENPLEFFNFLIRFKIDSDYVFLCESNKKVGCPEIFSFRTLICEFFYQAINCFDMVESYTIHCKNNICQTDIVIGHQPGKLDDQNFPAMCLIRTKFGEYIFNYQQIYEIYISNKINDPDYETINSLIILLCMTGSEPKVTTSYVIRKDIISTTTKF